MNCKLAKQPGHREQLGIILLIIFVVFSFYRAKITREKIKRNRIIELFFQLFSLFE